MEPLVYALALRRIRDTARLWSANHLLDHAFASNRPANSRGPQNRSERMRKLILALAAASAVSFAVPASAQTFYAGVGYGPSYGYYGGYGYGYPYRAAWGGPRFYGYDYAPAVTVYAAPPVARRYVVVRERPVVRRVVRTRPAVRYGGDAYAAYAYSPVTTYDSPFFGVTLGRGPGYSWWWD